MLGLKQEALASALGDDWTQRKVSLLEQKDVVENEVLDDVARALKVPSDAIKNFDDEAAILNIQNNYDGSTLNHSSNYQYNYQPTFNPIDKIMELYDALLKSEREKIDLMNKILEKLGK